MFRAPLKIHFGEQAKLFDSGRRQEKATLASAKADFPSLPEAENLLLSAQKQLLEPPFSFTSELRGLDSLKRLYLPYYKRDLMKNQRKQVDE